VVGKDKQSAWFRFHGVLEDFLPPARRGRALSRPVGGRPAIKDPIEALGVPHTEVGAILVDGRAVDLAFRIAPGARVAVYPEGPWPRPPGPPLRPPRPAEPAFVVDVNLGRLARELRLLGFDTLWRNDYTDAALARIAADQNRILLTRDRRLLRRRIIIHGFWVRAVEPAAQVREVVERLALETAFDPFRRCLVCNDLIEPVERETVLPLLQPLTRRYYRTFYRCRGCGRIYWQGSHFPRLLERLERLDAKDHHPEHPAP